MRAPEPDEACGVGRRGETVTIDLESSATQELPSTPGQMLEVFDGNVYVGSRNGTISSLDATTGAAVDPDDVHQPARALGSAGVRF